jgi:hypothetical protein
LHEDQDEGYSVNQAAREIRMKRLVVALIALLAVFTFIRDYSGTESAKAGPVQGNPAIVKAQMEP